MLYNPFDDIVPRQKKEEMKPKPEDQKKKKVKGTKWVVLYSGCFGTSKSWMSACPLIKPLSNFACTGQVLVFLIIY